MDNKPKKQRFFTFMVIPHDASGRTFSLKVPATVVYTVLGVVFFCALVVGSSVVYSTMLSRRLVHYYRAVAKNREQQQVIDVFRQRTDEVNQTIAQLVEEDNKLRRLLGLKNWKSKVALSSKIASDDNIERVSFQFKEADLGIAERKKSLEELRSWVNEVRQRFASTPSRWPLYGRVMSRFGYRAFPWPGFHSGIDISSSYGSPVRVTADGVVSFVGWQRGYGRTIIVTHTHGKSTLYGHLSRYAVNMGDKVKKGQLICYVGNSGYSTGPHLHYEVQTAGKPVNPVSYLDLNILSASRIWNNY